MKKVVLVFLSMFLMLLGTANGANAAVNEPKDFVGKWQVTVAGMPDGDLSMIANLKMEGNKLAGTLSSEGYGEIKIDEIVTKDKNATLYFSASGYDISLTFKLKDADNGVGDMLEMFDAVWKRVKE